MNHDIASSRIEMVSSVFQSLRHSPVQSAHYLDTYAPMQSIDIDVIIPVHDAAETLEDSISSALNQTVPKHLRRVFENIDISIAVCCHDDGSTDSSLRILRSMKDRHGKSEKTDKHGIEAHLLIGSNPDGVARGAGFARNRATELRRNKISSENSFICLLDSDDIMSPSRVAEQLAMMLSIVDKGERDRTLIGSTFDRIPENSTWHYSQWANGLTDERLMLERFRECTVLQPTWFLTRKRFEELGGYIEAPHPEENATEGKMPDYQRPKQLSLIHPYEDNAQTLRLAEDLRFFHEHLYASGLIKLHRHKPPNSPLVTYRHTGQSQSSSTPRKLLSALRAMAFEATVLKIDPQWSDGFVIWGAGRDGKHFFRSLSPGVRSRVKCFVDVDEKKISAGFYTNRELGTKVPIIHFSLLSTNPDARHESQTFGRIDKSRGGNKRDEKLGEADEETEHTKKKRRLYSPGLKMIIPSLATLPVVVCVAMYRTHGILEKNVKSIGRIEGKNLWHFS